MKLVSLKLNNIRSYTSQHIEFPDGLVLLSGDIGSGKSPVLQAIEFALFGTKRTDLPGSSLLRHGKKTGYAELNFNIDGKDITIKRTLKRSKDDVKQDSGYIIINGTKKEGTPTELKAAVLELLGYPDNMLTKSKDMVYKYTVYTPQESMKHILFEDKDRRLDVLRKVFNIDRYKTIKDNSGIYARLLRERSRELQGRISDLDSRKKELGEIKARLSDTDSKIKLILPLASEKKALVAKKKNEIKDIESSIKELAELKKELALNDSSLQQKLALRKKLADEKEKLSALCGSIESQLKVKHQAEARDRLATRQKELESIEAKQKDNLAAINALRTRIELSNSIKQKISGLDKCPTCEQDVDAGHKAAITERENSEISKNSAALQDRLAANNEIDKQIKSLKKEIDVLRDLDKEASLAKLRADNLKEKRGRIAEISNEQDAIKADIGRINMNKLDLQQRISGLSKSEEAHLRLEKELEELSKEERAVELKLVSLETEKKNILSRLEQLEKEIKSKELLAARLSRIKKVHDWLDEVFIQMVSDIERNVMQHIHIEFNELLKKWFTMLIEDERLSVAIDDSFTPVIEQDGYDTSIESLSGGEKTSVALAYRLALNKVVNDIVSTIKTKDIIMLDEPTDGFSSEQLDRVRDVLDELNCKQVIIVSHEQKIEGFVDHIIRLRKEEHCSTIS